MPAVTKVGGGRTVGFSYVQGAGDDDELWSRVSSCVPASYLPMDCSYLVSAVARLRLGNSEGQTA